MKKTGLILLLLALSVLTGCGNGETTTPKTESQTAAVSEVGSDMQPAQTEKQQKNETQPEEKTEFVEINNIQVYCPAWLKNENIFGYFIYSGSAHTEDTIYYHFSNLIYFDSESPTYIENASYRDVPSMVDHYTLDEAVKQVLPYSDSSYANTVTAEEDRTVNGYPFLRRTGVISAKSKQDDTVMEISYIAYYGLFPSYGDTAKEQKPVMWAAFTQGNDAATLKDMEALVDKTAEYAAWTK